MWHGLGHIFSFAMANMIIVFTASCGVKTCPQIKMKSIYYKSEDMRSGKQKYKNA